MYNDDCYIPYDDQVTSDCGCDVIQQSYSDGQAPIASGFDKLITWTKKNPLGAAAIAGGLWFLFFSKGKKKK